MSKQIVKREREVAHFPAFEPGALVEPNHIHTPLHGLTKRLSEAYGPSGSEESIRELVRDEIKEYVDQVRVDAMGNLIAHRRGSGNRRHKVMLSAHLDEIGLMVMFTDSRGFHRFGLLGDVKPLTLLGARVRFENGAMGVIGRNEKHASRTEIETDSLYLDVGSSASENHSVAVGASACFAREFSEMGDYWIGKALSGRAGCAILIETVRELKKSPNDLYFVFTVQQKIGARGAGAAAFAIQPDVAFVLDSALAHDVPGGAANGLALGKGPAIKFQDDGALTSASAREHLIQVARDARITYQLDVSPRAGGDALPIQSAREGVPTAILGIPLRYLNTASEMVHPGDVSAAVKILLGLVSKPL